MNNVPFIPRNRAGRKIHDLARRQVRDDHDLRAAVHRALAERSRSTGTGTDDWTRPALDTRRRVAPPTLAEPEPDAPLRTIDGTAADVPISLPQRRWAREALKFAAALLIFGIVAALLVLVLRGKDEDDSTIPGDATHTTASPTFAPIQQTLEVIHATGTASAGGTAAVSATANASLPSPGEVVATIPVGDSPMGLAITDDAIWVTNGQEGTVSRIDPATNTVVATVLIGSPGGYGPNGSPAGVVAYNGQVWVLNPRDKELARIDPASNQVAQTVSLLPVTGTEFPDVDYVYVDASGIWLSDVGGAQLIQIDPATGAVLASMEMQHPRGINSAFGSIWVRAGQDDAPQTIKRIDPTTHQVISDIAVAGNAFEVVVADGSIWTADWTSGFITRIDPVTNTVAETFDTGFGTTGSIIVTPSGIWVSSAFVSGVLRLDPRTHQPGQVIDLDHGGAVSMIEIAGSIWVTHDSQDVVTRIDPAP